MRVATFNVQNLRLRRPGGVERLDGARDGHALPPELLGGAALADPALDPIDRALTARLIAEADADVLALQEVFDQTTLDHFCERWLEPLGLRYPHRACLEGNDGRSQDVALVSRLPLDEVHGHAALTFAELGAPPPAGVDQGARVFRRDCLAVRLGELWLFVCHLKAVAPLDEAGHAVRRAEALAIRHVVEQRVRAPAADDWLILGDLNVHGPESAADLAPLAAGFAVDLMERLAGPQRWTFHFAIEGTASCPDRILASPALAARLPDARPVILRQGMARLAGDGPRFAEVGDRRPHASDHALVLVDLGAG